MYTHLSPPTLSSLTQLTTLNTQLSFLNYQLSTWVLDFLPTVLSAINSRKATVWDQTELIASTSQLWSLKILPTNLSAFNYLTRRPFESRNSLESDSTTMSMFFPCLPNNTTFFSLHSCSLSSPYYFPSIQQARSDYQVYQCVQHKPIHAS